MCEMSFSGISITNLTCQMFESYIMKPSAVDEAIEYIGYLVIKYLQTKKSFCRTGVTLTPLGPDLPRVPRAPARPL